MNEELKNKANDMLLEMLNGLEKMVDFSVEQLPLLVQELLFWNFTKSLILSVFWGLVLITSVIVFIKLLKWGFSSYEDSYLKKHESSPEIFIPSTIILPVLMICSVIVIFENLDWLKIMIAPRLYLLEYAASLIK